MGEFVPSGTMTVVELRASNVRRLKAVQIDASGNAAVVIGGNNGAGKSSVLDALLYALGGGRALPQKPVREGAKELETVVDLGELVVTRRVTARGSGELVVTANGAPLSSPQTILDTLWNRVACDDPLAFLRLPAAKQLEHVRKVVGLDTSELDAEHDRLYAARTEAGREVKGLKAQLDGMPRFPSVEPVDVRDANAQLEAATATNRENAEKRAKLDAMRTEYARRVARVDELTAQMRALQDQLDEAERMVTDAAPKIEAASRAVGALKDADTSAILDRIAQATEINDQCRQNAARKQAQADLEAAEAIWQKLDDETKANEARKSDALAQAKFPVDGLGWDESGLTFKGLPFAQASQAEQLTVAVGMALASAPTIKVILLREASLLDADNLALVAGMAAEAGAQLWIERVGHGEECSVVIEDGEVAL